jgi:ankyrin repeat protein
VPTIATCACPVRHRMLSERALLRAARRGQLRGLRHALASNAERVHSLRDAEGMSLLHVMAERDCVEGAELLLAAGADLEARARNSWTPLQYAARSGSAAYAALLLQAGAAVEAKVRHAPTPLLLAARGGHAAGVELLLRAGAQIEARMRDGATALVLAAHRGSEACIAALLAAGANVSAADRLGRTALHRAAEAGSVGSVHLLLRSGSAVDKLSRPGSPLHLAALRGREDCVKALLRAGADPFLVHSDRSTAVLRARTAGQLSLLLAACRRSLGAPCGPQSRSLRCC